MLLKLVLFSIMPPHHRHSRRITVIVKVPKNYFHPMILRLAQQRPNLYYPGAGIVPIKALVNGRCIPQYIIDKKEKKKTLKIIFSFFLNIIIIQFSLLSTTRIYHTFVVAVFQFSLIFLPKKSYQKNKRNPFLAIICFFVITLWNHFLKKFIYLLNIFLKLTFLLIPIEKLKKIHGNFAFIYIFFEDYKAKCVFSTALFLNY